MYILNDNSKKLIKYITIAFILLAVILFLGLNLPSILFAEGDDAQNDNAQNDNAQNDNA